MAGSWTRVQQELSLPPGPSTFEMIERAARGIDGEGSDLDWKRVLPTKPEAGLWSEFAKDVTAMANARGGLLVYGVRNDRVIEGGGAVRRAFHGALHPSVLLVVGERD
ncbi:ATP-binding protein [Streptomyces sp. TRM 70361]|uniref:AlbA family DNA-binding domain-containing protein n=1 Tax=Streptomyces sp. TRM 70361 TaxID=3116553 RepID=UPI002E7B6617|nr:ATP-binding protein [Streptomyces sp. TRM 70361]MEE1939721.1 ATP-binding protein [Streptomyces sp. TRM 70361]